MTNSSQPLGIMVQLHGAVPIPTGNSFLTFHRGTNRMGQSYHYFSTMAAVAYMPLNRPQFGAPAHMCSMYSLFHNSLAKWADYLQEHNNKASAILLHTVARGCAHNSAGHRHLVICVSLCPGSCTRIQNGNTYNQFISDCDRRYHYGR